MELLAALVPLPVWRMAPHGRVQVSHGVACSPCVVHAMQDSLLRA